MRITQIVEWNHCALHTLGSRDPRRPASASALRLATSTLSASYLQPEDGSELVRWVIPCVELLMHLADTWLLWFTTLGAFAACRRQQMIHFWLFNHHDPYAVACWREVACIFKTFCQFFSCNKVFFTQSGDGQPALWVVSPCYIYFFFGIYSDLIFFRSFVSIFRRASTTLLWLRLFACVSISFGDSFSFWLQLKWKFHKHLHPKLS